VAEPLQLSLQQFLKPFWHPASVKLAAIMFTQAIKGREPMRSPFPANKG
jgi:hypothetical protein